MESSRPLTSRLASAALSALLVLLVQPLTLPNTVQDKEKKNPFTDDDLKVEKIPGKWMLVSSYDKNQIDDYSVPLVVTGVNTFYGQDKYAGRVKIVEATLESRVLKLTRSVQLRWSIAMLEEPKTILLEGLMPFMDVEIEVNSARAVDIPPVYFNKIAKPLLKDGELSGRLILMVGIQEVRFADGTVWQRTPEATFLKAAFSSPPSALRPRYFKPALLYASALPNTAQDKEKKNPFTDDDLKVKKVSGKWSMGATPEQAQALDPSQPVIVKVLQIYSGRDKYVGHIKITEATIENRGPKATKTLQLRWSVVTLDNLETVILDGLMPAFEAEVQPYSSQELNIPPINFNKILKPLSKEGALEGTFVLLVGVQEAYFTDGSAWRRAQPVAQVKVPYMENTFSSRSVSAPFNSERSLSSRHR